MKARIILIICLITGIAAHLSANEKIYINREVTTHIVMPENIKMVDISTTKIIGNQCTDNIVRIKPYLENDSISSEGYKENELLGTLTIIGERHIAQYDILYTESPKYASTIYNVSYNETQSYINPGGFHANGRDCTICLGCLWKQKKIQPDCIKQKRNQGIHQQYLFHR